MKKLGVMQPYFFPYIGYWQLLNMVDEYVIFDDVNYIKRGWINRNNIILNGQIKRINLPILDASQNRLIKDTKTVLTDEEIKRLLSIIMQGYRKAPYFEEVYELLIKILNYEGTGVADFLGNQIREVCSYLEIGTKLLYSSEIDKNNQLKGEEKIINICQCRDADCYVNAIGGKDLYHQERFYEKGIELKFLRTEEIYYRQFEDEFIPNLSIIDVLMFNSVTNVKELLQRFKLEE